VDILNSNRSAAGCRSGAGSLSLHWFQQLFVGVSLLDAIPSVRDRESAV
jgi:hypothetical protein